MKQFSLSNLLTFCLLAFLLVGFLYERNRAEEFNRKLDLIRVPLTAQIQQLESDIPQQETEAAKAEAKLKSELQERKARFERSGEKFYFSFPADTAAVRYPYLEAKAILAASKDKLVNLQQELEPLK